MNIELQELRAARTHVMVAGALFLLACAGAVAAIHFLELRGLALVGAIAVPVVIYANFIRETNRRGTASGTVTPAQVRYNHRMGVMSLAYVALLVGAISFSKTYAPTGPLAWLVALLPALPVIGMIAAMMRLLIEEKDEYLRLKMATLALVATGFMLTVTTVWGFLETFRLVPHLPAYMAFIVWCLGLGVGTCIQRFRAS